MPRVQISAEKPYIPADNFSDFVKPLKANAQIVLQIGLEPPPSTFFPIQ
jgi:hypothetical protein